MEKDITKFMLSVGLYMLNKKTLTSMGSEISLKNNEIGFVIKSKIKNFTERHY